MKKIIKTAISFIVCIYILTAVINYAADFFGIGNNEVVSVIIESGSTTRDIAMNLKQNEIIKYPRMFCIVSKLKGYDGKFFEGSYNLSDNMSYGKIMKTLTTYNVGETVKVVIPEGFEIRHIIDRLNQSGLIDRDKFIDVINNYNFDYDFVKDIKNLKDRTYRLEGYMFPATYEIPVSYDEIAIVDMFLKAFDTAMTDDYKQRAAALGMSVDEVVTLASIVEREAKSDDDRATVSSVFHNRLKRSDNLGYLQSCATVQYILKERKEVLSVSDTKINSPYNTYINMGLPVGAIANPGEQSIKATLYPQTTDYYYFAANKNGTHTFSKTYDQHVKVSQ